MRGRTPAWSWIGAGRATVAFILPADDRPTRLRAPPGRAPRRRLTGAHRRVQVFKAAIDTRYSAVDVVSHSGHSTAAQPVGDVGALWAAIEPTTDVVAIDEAQFFGAELVAVCEELAHEGRRVLVAGLDLDFRGEPFGCIPQLMARADVVTK